MLANLVITLRARVKGIRVENWRERRAQWVLVRPQRVGRRIEHAQFDVDVRQAGGEKPVSWRGKRAAIEDFRGDLGVVAAKEPEVAAAIAERDCAPATIRSVRGGPPSGDGIPVIDEAQRRGGRQASV